MYKRIYILGAGSSIGHSKDIFPSITEFLIKAKETGLIQEGFFSELKKYTENILGKSVFDGNTKINIEELYTFIEIDIERNPSWELFATRQQLLKLIQNVLIELEKQIHNVEGEYNEFLNKKLTRSDTIITFNWDLLLDNILKREYCLKNYPVLDGSIPDFQCSQYGNFIYDLSALGLHMKKGIINTPYRAWNFGKGYYLKAHGSIDWFFCGNEACRAQNMVFPLLEPAQEHHCSQCHESLKLLIIPPVLKKDFRQFPLIRLIWNLAAKKLSSVDELIIWGYSLPPTDFYSSWLIRKARESSISKLAIINPSVCIGNGDNKKMKIETKFIRRFYDIFHDKLRKEAIYLYESFGDFCNSLDVIKKYNFEVDNHL
jgi:hypothetical protein